MVRPLPSPLLVVWALKNYFFSASLTICVQTYTNFRKFVPQHYPWPNGCVTVPGRNRNNKFWMSFVCFWWNLLCATNNCKRYWSQKYCYWHTRYRVRRIEKQRCWLVVQFESLFPQIQRSYSIFAQICSILRHIYRRRYIVENVYMWKRYKVYSSVQ